MQEHETILVNGLAEKSYRAIVEKAVRYALISVPFTYNRMGIDALEQKITNIAKGKTAEYLFRYFCISNAIETDFEICATEFFQPDKRDFVAAGYEWDIKNNFLYHGNDTLEENTRYTDLPALVPAAYDGDQWSKRNTITRINCKGIRFLFTFMKNLDQREKNGNFIDIHLTAAQKSFLTELYQQFSNNRKPESAPFSEQNFFDQFCFSPENFTVRHFPQLVITGYAGPGHWHLFQESGDGINRYCNGLLTTRINNRFVPVHRLPSFLSLYPHLEEKMVFGELRN